MRATGRLAGRPTRRGQFHEPRWPQAAPPAIWSPAFLRTRPRPLPYQRRRRRFHEPRWAEGPQTVWRPDWQPQAGPRPRFAAKLRRSRWFEPGWPQGLQFIGTPPRWVEEAGGGVGLVEAGGAGSGLVESGASSSGLVEGSGGV
jgi:hypothetical protein